MEVAAVESTFEISESDGDAVCVSVVSGFSVAEEILFVSENGVEEDDIFEIVVTTAIISEPSFILVSVPLCFSNSSLPKTRYYQILVSLRFNVTESVTFKDSKLNFDLTGVSELERVIMM